MKKYLPLLFGLFLLTSSYQCLSLSRGLEKDLKELENQLNVLIERLQELQSTQPTEKKDITKDPRYIALTNASTQNIEIMQEDELKQLLDDYTQLKVEVDHQKFEIQHLPVKIDNLINKIGEQLKKIKEKDKQILDKLIANYDQFLAKVNKIKPTDVRNKLQEFYKSFIVRKNGILPEESQVKISSLINSAVDIFIPLFKTNYRYFNQNYQKILNLFELITLDTKNWFDKKNMYKGKGVPYVDVFTIKDFELYKTVIENYEKLLEISTIQTFENQNQFLKKNKDFLKKLELWQSLPPTITNDYSPLEKAIIERITTILDLFGQMQIQNAQQKKDDFDDKLNYLRIITYRHGTRDALKQYAVLYQKIMNEPLTWSQDFTEFQKQMREETQQADSAYKKAKALYDAKPIKQRTEDDYKEIRSAIYKFVEYKAPSEELLEFYNKIGKEEPEELVEEEEEEFEEDIEKEEQLKDELDELQRQYIKGTLDISALIFSERQKIKNKIEEYRKLSGNPQAYFKLFLAVGVQ